jgi:two-component system, OmpR family, KDP operon response regulator KdpE
VGKISVLVADDDPKIRMLVRVNLTKRDYEVHEVADGAQTIAFLENEVPNLVLLDLVMPKQDGNEVCLWARRQGLDVPIMVMSAYDEEALKVQALDSGADDYVTKPFRMDEFLARVRALLRRAGPTHEDSSAEHIVKIQGLSIDLTARRAFVEGVDMHLTRTEFALLATLAQHLDSILSHDDLLGKVWGDEYRGSSHYLHVYLGRIRRKMGDEYSALLETVTGMGYILHSTPQEISE